MGLIKFVGHRLLGMVLLAIGIFLVLAGVLAMVSRSAVAMFVLFIVGIVLVVVSKYFLTTKHT